VIDGLKKMKSDIFRVINCPVPSALHNYHSGLDALFELMGHNGLKLHRSNKVTDIGRRDGFIGSSDVVLIKVNAQWKYKGCTNSDVVKGIIQRILEHPDGFDGEIIIFDNGQGGGSLKCDTEWDGRYPDAKTHANAENEKQSFSYIVDNIFNDSRVTEYLLDPIREKFIGLNDHLNDGYRKIFNISYPCFTTKKGNRIELREGIWNGKNYDGNLKLINIPVLKHHMTCGMTGALKSFYGMLSMFDGGYQERHYDKMGQHCGEMITRIKVPIINILDCIWVSHASLTGYPSTTTTRLNQLLASVDPVALDYWAAKHILYPISKNQEHNPERHLVLRRCLKQAKEVINSEGGIRGHQVTYDESRIKIVTTDASGLESIHSS
jgi:uncharacterized protein (DUF362 family)